MTDLELAKRNLAGHTICLCKDGKLLTSDKRGISPMMDFIEEGRDVTGYSVADKIVGKAAAFSFRPCGSHGGLRGGRIFRRKKGFGRTRYSLFVFRHDGKHRQSKRGRNVPDGNSRARGK